MKRQKRKSSILLPDSEPVPLRAIIGLHPIVLAMMRSHPPEPFPRMRGVSRRVVEKVFRVPRLGLVHKKETEEYWVVTGIRAFQLLKCCSFEVQIPCHMYGRLRDGEIAELAETDYYLTPHFGAVSPLVLHAHAELWKKNSSELCMPDGAGIDGADLLAGLLCIDSRRFLGEKSGKNRVKSDAPANSADKKPKGRAT